MRGTNTLATLRRTLSAARETIAAADAILHTGDAVHDEAGGYLWLQRELGSFDKPVLCVPGNHDEFARGYTGLTFGGIDVVVCNAGLRRQTKFVDMTYAEWREILSVALDGAFLLGRAAVPHMIPRGSGSIIALSGISTHVGTPNRCHVSASKSGLEEIGRAHV